MSISDISTLGVQEFRSTATSSHWFAIWFLVGEYIKWPTVSSVQNSLAKALRVTSYKHTCKHADIHTYIHTHHITLQYITYIHIHIITYLKQFSKNKRISIYLCKYICLSTYYIYIYNLKTYPYSVHEVLDCRLCLRGRSTIETRCVKGSNNKRYDSTTLTGLETYLFALWINFDAVLIPKPSMGEVLPVEHLATRTFDALEHTNPLGTCTSPLEDSWWAGIFFIDLYHINNIITWNANIYVT